MTHLSFGFSGLLASGVGGTKKIANQIPGCEHHSSISGFADWWNVYQKIDKHIRKVTLSTLSMFGHSNGNHAVLKILQRLDDEHPGFKAEYFGIIDHTYWAGPDVPNNVRWVQEYWAEYDKMKFEPGFDGKHEFFDLDRILGYDVKHSEAARVTETQNGIINAIATVQAGSLLAKK